MKIINSGTRSNVTKNYKFRYMIERYENYKFRYMIERYENYKFRYMIERYEKL